MGALLGALCGSCRVLYAGGGVFVTNRTTIFAVLMVGVAFCVPRAAICMALWARCAGWVGVGVGWCEFLMSFFAFGGGLRRFATLRERFAERWQPFCRSTRLGWRFATLSDAAREGCGCGTGTRTRTNRPNTDPNSRQPTKHRPKQTPYLTSAEPNRHLTKQTPNLTASNRTNTVRIRLDRLLWSLLWRSAADPSPITVCAPRRGFHCNILQSSPEKIATRTGFVRADPRRPRGLTAP